MVPGVLTIAAAPYIHQTLPAFQLLSPPKSLLSGDAFSRVQGPKGEVFLQWVKPSKKDVQPRVRLQEPEECLLGWL